MKPDGSGSRRDLVATVTGGAIIGALWGAAFPIVATERRPTIAVVGHHNSQVILIDSSAARVLLFSGEPDDQLLHTLPAMMTVFRQRIDVLVASPGVLAKRAKSLADRWRIRHVIAPSSSMISAPTSLSTTVVDESIGVALADDMHLALRIGYRQAWRSDVGIPDAPLWSATLRTNGGDVVIAPDIASILAIGPPSSALVIVPNAPDPNIMAVSPTAALAVNFDSASIDGPSVNAALTRVFPRDVARFVVDEGKLEAPEWTVPFRR